MCQSGIAIFFPLLWPIPSVSSSPAAYVFSRSRATSFSVSSSSSSPSSQPEIHPKGIPMTFSWGREGEKMGWGWVGLKWDSIAQEVHSVLSLFPFPPTHEGGIKLREREQKSWRELIWGRGGGTFFPGNLTVVHSKHDCATFAKIFFVSCGCLKVYLSCKAVVKHKYVHKVIVAYRVVESHTPKWPGRTATRKWTKVGKAE